jgi:hypothetical protein
MLVLKATASGRDDHREKHHPIDLSAICTTQCGSPSIEWQKANGPENGALS